MTRSPLAEDRDDASAGIPGARILNRASLLEHGDRTLRSDLLDIVLAGIHGADPRLGTLERVSLEGQLLHVGGRVLDLAEVERLTVIGAGKASFGIAAALEEVLSDWIDDGIVMVKRGETGRLRRIEVREAGHPLPDEDSVEGAARMLELARSAGPRDLVLLAITGGASALATLPPDGVGLDDVRTLTNDLLGCGATIREINTVRRHLCQLKGGRLVDAVQPAEAITFALDTAPKGLPWPDMCLPDPSTFADAMAVLEEYGLWERAPSSIRAYLRRGSEQPDLDTIKSLEGARASIISVGDPPAACKAAADHAASLGYHPAVLSSCIEGEARELGVFLAGVAQQMTGEAPPFPVPSAIISAGETTVTTNGEKGHGGPNQETALAFAEKLAVESPVAFAAIDSDGTDGPTDVAGGLVDWTTAERASDRHVDVGEALRTHHSSMALTRLGDAIITGHTGTNVMNLRVLLVADTAHQAPAAEREPANDVVQRLQALEILSGSGRPTVEVTLQTSGGEQASSSVPSGTSKGKYEAFELLDGGARYRGLGVTKAVENVRDAIATAIVGLPVADQARIDATLLALDGTENLRRLGGNAVLAVSMAVARAGASSRGVPLYEHLGGAEAAMLPVPIATVIAGGQHSPSPLDIEDYILIPDGFARFSDAVEALVETRMVLEEMLCARYGPVPDTGGALAAPLRDSRDAFSAMLEAAEKAGYGGRMNLGVDVAASGFYESDKDRYVFEGASRTRAEVVAYFAALAAEFPLVFIEDAFDEDDFDGFRDMTAALPHLDIVGDDLFASNSTRIQMGIDRKAGNALLLKVNQIGTVGGALAAGRLAASGGLTVTVSLRSSDTNDSFIADLAVGLEARRIKLGSPVRGERNAKYNRLLEIEQDLGARARLAGSPAGREGKQRIGSTQEEV
jgi:phosphopyruvate hydratase